LSNVWQNHDHSLDFYDRSFNFFDLRSNSGPGMAESNQEASVATTVLLSIYDDLSEHRDVFDRGLAKFRIEADDLQDSDGQISLRSFVQILEWLA